MVLLLSLTLMLLHQAASGNDCLKRDFNRGSIVCVCDENHCDNFERPDPSNGVVIIRSSKDGKRFETRYLYESPNVGGGNSLKVELKPCKMFQKIVGFGGAFSDSAAINIKSLKQSLGNRLLADYFGKDGIEYNMGRVTIAGSDFSTHPYAYNEVPNDFELQHFKLTEEDTEFKIPLIKMAEKLCTQKLWVFGSAWSPPKWMKSNGELTGAATLIGPIGGKYYETWAHYHLKFIQEYKKQGVSLWGITTGNEPTVAFNASDYYWNTVGFTPEMLREFVKQNLGPTLHKAGLNQSNFELMIYDDLLETIEKYLDATLSDSIVNDYVTSVAFHWYRKSFESNKLLEKVHKKYPSKTLLNTEACIVSRRDPLPEFVSLGNWTRGEKYAMDIIQDLNQGVAGWVDWNLALDTEGGPNWVKNYVDSPIIVNASANEYYKQPMFYAMGHFSKFLKAGSFRIESVATESNCKVDHTSFLTPEGHIVFVILNFGEDNCDVVLSHKQKQVEFALENHTIATVIWKL